VQERKGWHVYRRGRFSGMRRDNGWRENPDIPAEEEEEEKALAKA
jgi:hypothetical protein